MPYRLNVALINSLADSEQCSGNEGYICSVAILKTAASGSNSRKGG